MDETTKLSPIEEAMFQLWAGSNRDATGVANHEGAPYDMRGFWDDKLALSQWKPGDHFPDRYKQHPHPTFSSESKYSSGVHDGGMWIDEHFLPQPRAAVSHTSSSQWTGPGNINLFTRPRTKNLDGSSSSLYSTSFEEDGDEVLIPGVDRTGKGILRKPDGDFDPQAAITQFKKTGEFLGKFKDVSSANAYGGQLHKDSEAGLYKPPLASSRQDVNPEELRKVLLFLLTRSK